MQKILLDTDIGGDIDDAVCLAYLLREPQCALLGVTTVCGESEKRAAGALACWPHRSFERGDAPGLLRGLFVMNGCFGEAPLPELWYNWNAWADPLAARLVFEAQVPLHRVVPLEVTEQLTLPAREAQALLPPNSPPDARRLRFRRRVAGERRKADAARPTRGRSGVSSGASPLCEGLCPRGNRAQRPHGRNGFHAGCRRKRGNCQIRG